MRQIRAIHPLAGQILFVKKEIQLRRARVKLDISEIRTSDAGQNV